MRKCEIFWMVMELILPEVLYTGIDECRTIKLAGIKGQKFKNYFTVKLCLELVRSLLFVNRNR